MIHNIPIPRARPTTSLTGSCDATFSKRSLAPSAFQRNEQTVQAKPVIGFAANQKKTTIRAAKKRLVSGIYLANLVL